MRKLFSATVVLSGKKKQKAKLSHHTDEQAAAVMALMPPVD